MQTINLPLPLQYLYSTFTFTVPCTFKVLLPLLLLLFQISISRIWTCLVRIQSEWIRVITGKSQRSAGCKSKDASKWPEERTRGKEKTGLVEGKKRHGWFKNWSLCFISVNEYYLFMREKGLDNCKAFFYILVYTDSSCFYYIYSSKRTKRSRGEVLDELQSFREFVAKVGKANSINLLCYLFY